jgi:hypothetical protein
MSGCAAQISPAAALSTDFECMFATATSCSVNVAVSGTGDTVSRILRSGRQIDSSR